MFYFRFLRWMFGKANYIETKWIYGDTGIYNGFDKDPSKYSRPGLLRLLVAFIFIGLPMIGYILLVYSLPFSENIQYLILVLSALLAFIVTARTLIRMASRRR